MNIAFDASDLASGRADGTTRYTWEIARRLPSLHTRATWHFFMPEVKDSPYARQLHELTRFHNARLHISRWPMYWTQTRFLYDILRLRPDVLFMPVQQLPMFRPRHMKTVAVVHDLAFHWYGEQFTHKDWLLLHTFTAQVAREADDIIAVSGATAHDIHRVYGRSKHVHTIHHGIDHNTFRLSTDNEMAESERLLSATFPTIRKPYMFFIGQIQPRKNIICLVEAFERIKHGFGILPSAVRQRITLVIAGSHGWLQKPIHDRAAQSKFSQDILFLGRVEDQLLPSLFWHASEYVLPSLYEGFGMPILEAFACGCPVVTSNVSSMPEVAHGAAILIDPLDSKSLAQGMCDAIARREDLIKQGRRRVLDFSWDVTAQETLNVILS